MTEMSLATSFKKPKMTPPLRSKPKAKSVGKKATSCSSTNKPNAKRGRPPLFGANNIISDDLTNKIIETLKERTHLHQNEIKMRNDSLKVCRRSVPLASKSERIQQQNF